MWGVLFRFSIISYYCVLHKPLQDILPGFNIILYGCVLHETPGPTSCIILYVLGYPKWTLHNAILVRSTEHLGGGVLSGFYILLYWCVLHEPLWRILPWLYTVLNWRVLHELLRAVLAGIIMSSCGAFHQPGFYIIFR
jgi:hypothetical protein